jgi:hypothetical protein
MKLRELKRCIKNSWCVEKHWDAIIEVVLAAHDLYYHDRVHIDAATGSGYEAMMRLRTSLLNLENIEWKNETSLSGN